MIPKRIVNQSWFGQRPLTTMLDVWSKGLNQQQMQKIAASDEFRFNADVEPEKGYSFLHVITLGAGDTYGPNNNGDWFNKSAREFRCANGTRIPLGGGLDEYHETFTKYGAVYRNHFNSKKGGKPQGEVIAQTVNPQMNRGELILKVANDAWHDDLEKLANGDLIWWSMGTSVPRDICSICGNSAPTRNQYCEHARYMMNGLDKQGNAVFVINDQPHFHDISEVGNNPADRIAGTLQKVAAEQRGTTFTQEDVSRLWVPLDVVNAVASRKERDRLQLIDKMAKIEKRIKVQGMLPEEEDISQAFAEGDDEIVQKCSGIPLEQLMHALNSSKQLLPPKTFVRIVMQRPEEEIAGLPDLPDAIKDIFSHIKETGGAEEMLSDGSYAPSRLQPPSTVLNRVKDLSGQLSLETEPVRKRVVIIALRGGQKSDKGSDKEKEAASKVTPEARVLAKEYAKYQLSFLAGAGSDSERFLRTVAIHNQAF